MLTVFYVSSGEDRGWDGATSPGFGDVEGSVCACVCV